MRRLLSILAFVAVTLSAAASEWPNWRGPDHDGISTEIGWSAHWPADGPPQLWKVSVGTGFATVSVSHNRVYTVGNGGDTDTVFCLDADTGKVVWKYSYHCALSPNMYEGGPSATPTIDNGRVYTLSKNGDFFCLTADAGKVLWEKHFTADGKISPPMWGFSSSAVILGDRIFLNVGSLGAALDKNSGHIIWNSEGAGAGYASAVPCNVAGTPAIVMLLETNFAAIDISNGKALWRVPWETDFNLNIADAIVSGPRVFASSDYAHGSELLQLANGSNVWTNHELGNHIQSSVLLDGYLYGVNGHVLNPGGALKCLDFATGAVKWSYDNWNGSLIIADKKIIALSDKGELLVANASPAGFNPISRAQVLGGKCWTSPVLANGRIYCRNARGDLVCLDVKQK